ncbi:MAG: triple tyrosine motif-containing protein [Acidobacteriota bacterium]
MTRLFEDTSGVLWVATQERLLRLEPGRAALGRGLPGKGVATLYEDHHGYLLVAAGRSLFRRVHSAFSSVNLPLHAPETPIHAVVMAPDGALLLGRDDGLARLTGSFEKAGLPQTFEPVPGFEDTRPRLLHRDRDDVLWMVAEGGELTRLLASGADTLTPMPGGEILSLHEDLEGTLWLGSSLGLVRLRDPEAGLPQPEPQIDSLEAGLAPMRPRGRLELPPGSEPITLRFTAAAVNAGGPIRFRHRLEGLDDAWRETGERSVTYASLPAGEYRFRLQAAYGEGDWGDDTVELSFVRSRTLTWLVIVGVAAVLAGLALAVAMVRRGRMGLASD